MKVRCKPCNGSGKVMGGGMLLSDCDSCDGVGKTYPLAEHKEIKLDKENKHYKKAINKIKDLHENISDEEAEKIFEEEFKNIK